MGAQGEVRGAASLPGRALSQPLVVVIAHARSGSTVLTSAMGRHPQVRMHGEVFAGTERERARAAGPAAAYEEGEDPVRYVERLRAPRGWLDHQVVGFKLLYAHARTGQARRIWTWLAKNRDVRVIHLVRRDALATLVSLETANRSGVWAQYKDAMPPTPVAPFALSAEECLHHFVWLDRQARMVERAFADHPFLSLRYEDDVDARFDETLERVWRFLDVFPWAVEPPLVRQRTRPVREQLSNYDELRRHFAGTEHAKHFAECEREVTA